MFPASIYLSSYKLRGQKILHTHSCLVSKCVCPLDGIPWLALLCRRFTPSPPGFILPASSWYLICKPKLRKSMSYTDTRPQIQTEECTRLDTTAPNVLVSASNSGSRQSMLFLFHPPEVSHLLGNSRVFCGDRWGALRAAKPRGSSLMQRGNDM